MKWKYLNDLPDNLNKLGEELLDDYLNENPDPRTMLDSGRDLIGRNYLSHRSDPKHAFLMRKEHYDQVVYPIIDGEEQFTRTILANPNDQAPQLVFADWLTEQGEEERAVLVRYRSYLRQRLFLPQDEVARSNWLDFRRDNMNHPGIQSKANYLHGPRPDFCTCPELRHQGERGERNMLGFPCPRCSVVKEHLQKTIATVPGYWTHVVTDKETVAENAIDWQISNLHDGLLRTIHVKSLLHYLLAAGPIFAAHPIQHVAWEREEQASGIGDASSVLWRYGYYASGFHPREPNGFRDALEWILRQYQRFEANRINLRPFGVPRMQPIMDRIRNLQGLNMSITPWIRDEFIAEYQNFPTESRDE